ncbi:MAG: tetratricopeptide repeat protein [Methanobacteriota archaeon]
MPYGSDDYRSYKMDANQKALEKLLRKAKDYRDEQAQPVRQPEPLPPEQAVAPKSDSDTIALLKRVMEKDRALIDLEQKLNSKERELAVRESALNDERTKLDSRLRESKEQLEDLERQREASVGLKRELEEWNAKREQVYSQLLNMERELGEREARVKAMEARAADNERDLVKGLEILQGLEKRDEELGRKEQDLLRWEEAKRIEHGMLSKREEQSKVRDEELSYREKELARERAEVHKAMDEAARARSDLDGARRDLDGLGAENARLASAAKDSEARRSELEARITELKSGMESVKVDAGKAEVLLAEERRGASALRSELDAAKRVISELEAGTVPKSRLDEKESEISRLHDELEKAGRDLEEVKRDTVGREALEAKDRETAALRSEMESAKAETRAKATELEPLLKERKELAEQVLRYRKLLDSMQKGLQKASGLDKALHGLQKESEMLRKHNEDLMAKAGALEAAKAESKNREAEAKEARKKTGALEAELKLLKEASRGLGSKADELKSIRFELKKRDEELARALYSLGEAKKVAEEFEERAAQTSVLKGEAERARDLERRIKEQDRELERARAKAAEADELRERQERMRAELDRLGSEASRTSELRSVLATVETERDRLRSELDMSRRDGDELRRTKEAMGAVEGELHRAKAELAQATREAEWSRGVQSLLQDKERELFDLRRETAELKRTAEERDALAAKVELLDGENSALRAELGKSMAFVEEKEKSLVTDLVERERRIGELESRLSKETEKEKEESEHFAEVLLEKQSEIERLKGHGGGLPRPLGKVPRAAAPEELESERLASPEPKRPAQPPSVTLGEALARASTALRTGHPRQAMRILDELDSIDPGHPKILQLRSVAHVKLGDYHSAYRDLKGALEAEGESPTLLLSMGYCALKNRDYAEALRRFEGGYRMGAPANEALEGAAEAMFALGRFEDAAEVASKLESHNACILAGRAMHKLGRGIEAEASFKRAFDTSPDRPDAGIELAKLALDRGDVEGAVLWAKRAVSADPGSRDAKKLYERALAESRKGRGGPGQWVAS